MDPLSIAASVTAVATLCGKILILCNQVAGRQQSIRRTLASLRTEIFAYQVSLHRIHDLLLDQTGSLAEYLTSNNEWTESFDTALSGCSLTASILFGELQKAIDSSTGSLIRFTLNELEIKDLIGQLRGQQASIQLLMQTLQLNSISDIYQLLSREKATLLHAKRQTSTLAESWGVPNPGSGLQSDTFSILSMDPDDLRFDFDEELARMGPYRRALLSQRANYQQAPQPIANLIDDDLLDLSIEPLIPGPWTQELQLEFVTGAFHQPNDKNVERLGQEFLEKPIKELEKIEELLDEQIVNGKSSEGTIEKHNPDNDSEDKETLTLKTERHFSHAKASNSTDTLTAYDKKPSAISPNAIKTGRDTPTTRNIVSSEAQSILSEETVIEERNQMSPTASSAPLACTAVDMPILQALKDDFAMGDGYLVPRKLDREELAILQKDAPLHHAAYIGDGTSKASLPLHLKIKSLYKNKTALSYAAIAGNVKALENLLRKGSSIDCKGPFGFSALHWAIIHGHLAAVEILIKEKSLTEPCSTQNKDMNIFEGWTPLAIAAHFGHLDIVQYLLRAKTVTKQKYSPAKRLLPPFHAAVASVPYLLMFKYFKQPFSSFRSQDLLKLSLSNPKSWLGRCGPRIESSQKIDIIELLIKARLNEFNIDGVDTAGLTALQAASCGTSTALVEHLLKMGAKKETIAGSSNFRSILTSVPSTLNHRDGPLHLAVYWGRTSIVNALLQSKANPDARGVKERTPLHYAAIIGNLEVINLLIEGGASVDSNTFDYQNGPDFEFYKARTPLLSALEYRQWDSARLLIILGASLKPFYRPLEVPYKDSRELSETILILVLKQKMSERFTATKVLLESGASLHETDSRGNQPLNALATNASALPLEYEYLLEKGADPNALDSDGIAPLQRVIMTGSKPELLYKVVEILLKRGADPSLKNKHAVNALTRAESLYNDLVDGKVHLNHNIDDLREVTWILDGAKKSADLEVKRLSQKQSATAIEQAIEHEVTQ